MSEQQTIKNLATALLAAQREIGTAVKDGENTYFSTKDKTASYATLSSVIDAVKPALNKYGIVFVQALTPPPFEGCLALTTTLLHAESGESISGTAVVPLAKDDPQGFGSAVTYTRRYALTAILGLKTEDDDGNAASNLPPPRQQQAARPRPERIEQPTGYGTRPAPVTDNANIPPAPAGWGSKAKKPDAAFQGGVKDGAEMNAASKAASPPPRGKTGVFPTVAKGKGKALDVKADRTPAKPEAEEGSDPGDAE